MAVRIALQSSEADSRLILAEDNPVARLLSRPGEAYYNSRDGQVEGNNRFQVAYLPDEQRDWYLRHIRALADQRKYHPDRPQIVFEGDAPADVQQNRFLHDHIAAPEPPLAPRSPRVWLGEPVAIGEPVVLDFRRQSGNNLLVVGQNDEMALSMIALPLISLAAQFPAARSHGRGAAHFHILDFGTVDGPHAELLTTLAKRLPHPISLGRRRELPSLMSDLADEVQRRIDEDDGSAPPHYLFVYGLQRARDLRNEESFGFRSFGEGPAAPTPAEQFSVILREGPDVGVHSVIWCDTVTNLNRTLDRRAVREFSQRVVFHQGSPEDSANLVDSPAASRLGPYHALLYSDDDKARLEKFRPYAVPSDAWLTWACEQLQRRSE